MGKGRTDITERTKRFCRFLERVVTALLALVAAGVFLGLEPPADGAPIKLSEQAPVSIVKLRNGDYLLDFGLAAFGNLRVVPKDAEKQDIIVRFGEVLRDGHVDRSPPGTVRYSEVKITLEGQPMIVAPPADPRNTKPPAVSTPADFGVLTPFRWIEISGWHGGLSQGAVQRRAAFDSTWNDEAASFQSSDPMLDRIWDLCHYSIKATTYAGIFVDGDRERLAYEADAYQNQLSYYAGNPGTQMERDTFERLMRHPTWPTEWAPQMVFMAYEDWMQTGDTVWLASHYEFLRSKTLSERVGADGLVHSTAVQMAHADIVDWPPGERDGYVFTPINTVVNAFHLHAVDEMRKLALALGKESEAALFAEKQARELTSFQKVLFNEQTGLYRDGAGTDHSSLHANLFTLAFGLAPVDKRAHVAEWLARRGMRASPYAAQFLMEALFENGQAAAAIQEMTGPGDRSWRHMVESGTTITWEAWDQRYKPNQDWNHAWGAAPANLIPRFVLGVKVSKPGWAEVEIAPHPGGLTFASGVVPTPRGPIRASWDRSSSLRLTVELPEGMKAKFRLPAGETSHGVLQDGHAAHAHREGDWWVIDEDLSGRFSLEAR